MDKFGIFNLINSFLDYYENKKETPKKDDPTPQNENPIFKKTNTEKGTTQQNSKPDTVTKSHNKSPLINSLISTINLHDKFVERVYKNNQPQK